MTKIQNSKQEFLAHQYLYESSLNMFLTFEHLDSLAYRVENELINLVKSMSVKHGIDGWSDALSVRETLAEYGETEKVG